MARTVMYGDPEFSEWLDLRHPEITKPTRSKLVRARIKFWSMCPDPIPTHDPLWFEKVRNEMNDGDRAVVRRAYDLWVEFRKEVHYSDEVKRPDLEKPSHRQFHMPDFEKWLLASGLPFLRVSTYLRVVGKMRQIAPEPAATWRDRAREALKYDGIHQIGAWNKWCEFQMAQGNTEHNASFLQKKTLAPHTLPSKWETYCLMYLELMESGIPLAAIPTLQFSDLKLVKTQYRKLPLMLDEESSNQLDAQIDFKAVRYEGVVYPVVHVNRWSTRYGKILHRLSSVRAYEDHILFSEADTVNDTPLSDLPLFTFPTRAPFAEHDWLEMLQWLPQAKEVFEWDSEIRQKITDLAIGLHGWNPKYKALQTAETLNSLEIMRTSAQYAPVTFDRGDSIETGRPLARWTR